MRSGLILAAALALTACAQPVTLPASPVPAGPGITIVATAVALNPQEPGQDRVGAFRYAGGLVLSSPDTARFHGLSDLAIGAGGAVTTVSDEGDLIKARLVLDKTGRLVGLTDGRVSALTNPDGKPLQGKQEGDSEGLAVLPNGDLLVSFEQRHRIWLYPAAGGAPRPAPAPQAAFPDNGGLEALGPDAAAGADAYVAGAEESGQTWTCRVSTTCVPGPVIAKPPEFGLVAVTRLPQGRTAWVLRAWDPVRGNRVSLVVRDDKTEVARMDLARPLTIDNFEAVAAVPARDGTIRFYLLSDDNFQSSQRTLLLAFDWKP
ncbi:MAG: esterase-like activity of phytase family protein [Pseudomonadota bacterium]